MSIEQPAGMDLEQIIRAYWTRGYRVFPLENNSKIPKFGLSWKVARYWSIEDTLKAFNCFNNRPDIESGYNLGIIAGDFLVIDFDADKIDGSFHRFDDFPKLFDNESSVSQITPSGGTHQLFKHDRSLGQHVDKLRSKGIKNVDVRAEAGYIVGFPSFVEGVQYFFETDDCIPPKLDELPEMDPAFKLLYLGADATLKQYAEPDGEVDPNPGTAFDADHFDVMSFDKFISEHGWSSGSSSKGKTKYYRPGKDPSDKTHSAIFENGKFYVYTTADPFLKNREYFPSEVFAYCEHHGDFKAAWISLLNKGYGSEQPLMVFPGQDQRELSEEMLLDFEPGENKNYIETKTTDEEFLDDLIKINPALFSESLPGLLGLYVAEVKKHNPRYLPEITLAAALTAISTFIGHGFGMTVYNSRCNLYTIGLAPSGSGKDYCRKLNQKLIEQVSYTHENSDIFSTSKIVSEAGICSSLHRGEQAANSMPFHFSIDEVANMIRQFADPKNQQMIGASEKLMEIYGQPTGMIQSSAKLNKKERIKIHNPFLSLMGVSTIKGFYDGLNDGIMQQGFMGRMIIFCSEDPPELQSIKQDEYGAVILSDELRNESARLSATMNGQPEPALETDDPNEWNLDDDGFISDVAPGSLGSILRDLIKEPIAHEYQFTDEAWKAHQSLERDLIEICKRDIPGIESFSRSGELITKLCIIYQVCKDRYAAEVGIDVFNWARSIVFWALASNCKRFLRPTKGFEALWLHSVEQSALKAGVKGITSQWIGKLALRLQNCPIPSVRKAMFRNYLTEEDCILAKAHSPESELKKGHKRIFHKKFLIQKTGF